MSSKTLNNLFNKLGLVENESVFLFNEEGRNACDYLSKETFKKLELIKPDAVYVFNKQPYILFFDLTNTENQSRASEIHKQVWSFDQAPIMIFAKENSEEYYNALEFDKKTGTLSQIINKEINGKINFWDLQSGETLDWFYNKREKFKLNKRVHQQLFENIQNTILLLNEKLGLEKENSKILVLRLIFVRYLIDRKIKIDSTYIEGIESEVIKRRKSFSELIANPTKLQIFFRYLNDRFNGVLFKNKNENGNELLTLNQAQLLSQLFNPDGVSQEVEQTLFYGLDFQYEIFDFGIIPVELISGIYETLLEIEVKNATSAIYTPPFLVDYILTETVDKYFVENPETSECKIFDPAMGSGIFLVQGLRRMIERELELNPNQTNAHFGQRIKEIAENNLFGIDINEEAINVACFSIYVALLDYQEPGDIDVYHFPNLSGKNFFKVHFFDLEKEHILNKIKKENVDLILGNPPWKSNNSPEHLDWLKKTKFDEIVSDKQIAQSYLIRIKDFAENNPKIALIVTSKVYFNNKAKKFKKYFLENNAISEIFDLSPVRRIVFEQADNPGAILFYQSKLNQKESNFESLIKHISLKQNKFFNKFSKSLVVEKFDQKLIQQKHFLENEWMFKVALYGNTLDYLFLKKIENENKSIFKYINKSNLTKAGNGIHKGTPKRFFNDLMGLPIIETDHIKRYYTSKNSFTKILEKDDVYLEAGRNVNLFIGNKILFTRRPKNETEISVSLCEESVVFRNSTYGVPIGKNDKFQSQIFSVLISSIYTYYQYLISSNWGIYNPEINLNEYLSFPYIEPNEIQIEKLNLLIMKLLAPYKEHYENSVMDYSYGPNPEILKQIDEIINEIYGISGYEKDLIDYVLNVSRYQFQSKKEAQLMVSSFKTKNRNQKNILTKYVEVYVQEFEKIYDNSFFEVEVYNNFNHFIAILFIVSDDKPKNEKKISFIKDTTEADFFEKLSSTSISAITDCKNSENNLFIQKDIKGFEENSFYIIKPKEYKCWHRAMAWYDVAEFKEAIQVAELQRLESING